MIMQMIGWMLLHSVWQAGVVAVLTALALYLMRHASAAARYWAGVLGMILLVAMPIVTVAVSGTGTGGVRAAPTAFTPSFDSHDNVAIKPSPDIKQPELEVRSASPTSPVSPSLRLRMEKAFPWIVTLWLLGVLIFSLRTIAGLRWAHRLTREGVKPVSDQMRGAAARIADAMGVRVAVRVLESSRVTVPMLVGWMRPVILMPVSLFNGLMPQQIEAILAHELAHVRRHDYAVNLLQTVVETLFFFHPAAWWLSGRIREERENACDELAVAACGGDRVFYSRVLLTVEESRGEVPALAVAASGGSLSRRIYRLLGAQQAHLDIGPRWYAGVFTIALAVVTAGGVFDANAEMKKRGNEATNGKAALVATDTSKARPDTVIRYMGNGNLDERWTWGTTEAKRHGYNRYWVGYLIDGNPDYPNWLYFDRNTPVNLGNNTVMSGHLRMGKDFDNVHIAGIPLQKVLGDEEPHRIVLLVGYERGRLARLHVSSFVFPMNFAGAPLLWLGRAPDVQSIAHLVRLDGETRDPELREDITAALGAHSDPSVAPILAAWAQDPTRPEDVRKEAVESLPRLEAPGVLGLLARIARSNETQDVRAEAVEAIGEVTDKAAYDTLLVFIRELRSDRLQDEAIEGLANLPDGRGMAALQQIVDDRTLSSDLRGKAIEEFAHRSESPEMIKALVDYTNRKDAQDVQRRAVEAIGDINGNDAERVRALVNVVETHPDPEIQGRAAEALGNIESHDLALAALTKIAREHRNFDVRRHAMEALGNLNEDELGGKVLLDIARNHPDDDTRRRAVEFMENYHEFPVFKEVAVIAMSDRSIDVRRKAVETYMDAAPTDDAVAFARKLLNSDASLDLKRKVLESLGDVDDGAGIPMIIEVAKTSKDPELRRRALEALIDSDDPKAVAALRKVQ